MIRKIITYPHPLLREKSLPVTRFDAELQTLIADMAETMFKAPGAGLAAVQIGVNKQLVVINTTEEDEEEEAGGESRREKTFLTLVNPEIIEGSGAQTDVEGCLSVLDLTAKVKRFLRVKVRAQNAQGEPLEFEAEEFFARVIQHEFDHLQGTLFLDHLSALKRNLYKKKIKKQLAEEGN